VPEGSYAARIATVNAWKPPDPHPRGGADLGRILFGRLCAVCHGVDGRGDGVLASRFARPPANLVAGPLPHTGDAWPPNERRIRAQRVVKFGILGSDMPGHETLEDEEIAALSGFVLQLRQEAIPKSP
jgi:cytochrome c oxidase cbb3-type subunit 2